MHFDVVVSTDGRDVALFKDGEKIYGTSGPTPYTGDVSGKIHRTDNIDAFVPPSFVPNDPDALPKAPIRKGRK